jgi:hypothetical protein
MDLVQTKCKQKNVEFFCVGVMYSGEYDTCDVTLSVYPHRSNITSIIFT